MIGTRNIWVLFIFYFISFDLFSLIQKIKKDKKSKKLYDCKNYHKGKFSYTDISGMKILILRDDKFQILYREFPSAYKKKSITWISDCKYKSKVIEIHDPFLNDSMLGKENLIEIGQNRNKDFYEYRNWENGELNTGIMYVIHE